MKYLHTGFSWMDKLIPDGIPLPSSTIITGPAGAGKPIIGAMISNSWLKLGGTLVCLLINFKRDYMENLLTHFDKDIPSHKDRLVYIEFDPLLESVEKSGSHLLRANLLKPDDLDLALKEAKTILPDSDPGPLIYGSALNMLLFSKTYGPMIHQKILALLNSSENILFTIANNFFEEQATEWEEMTDNLFYSHSTGIMHLGFKIIKMKEVSFHNNEVEVPLTEDELRNIRAEAEKGRQHLIPMIRKI